MSTIRDSLIRLVLGVVGPNRVLHSVRKAAPSLVGAYVTSDYPKHLLDPAFQIAHGKAVNHTLVDVLRQHELWSLVRQSAKLPVGDILEVGVWRGGTGLVLAEAMKHFGVSGKLYLADTFTGVVGASELDSRYVGGEHADTSESIVRALLSQHGHGNVQVLTGIFPQDTGDRIKGPLRLIHLDVDVYLSSKGVVDWAFDRIVTGGIIVFDDYGCSTCDGVTKLCEEYEVDSRFIFIHNFNGHCVLIKR